MKRFVVRRALAIGGVFVASMLGVGCGGHAGHHAHHHPHAGPAVSSPASFAHAHEASSSSSSATGASPCACADARAVDGWCGACRVGYIAEIPIRSAVLFDAIDPHGHAYDAASLSCAGCRAALAEEGFCEGCGRGFSRGMLYASRPVWALSRGDRVDVGTLRCDECRLHAASTGWCAACNVGMVGPAVFDDRASFDTAVAERDRLRHAASTAERCELCAVGVITGVSCPSCVPASSARPRTRGTTRSRGSSSGS